MREVCTIPGCKRPSWSRGWCNTHYTRWRRTGDPLGSSRVPVSERSWSKVDKSGDCWLWTGGVDRSGYGIFGWNGRAGLAHRAAWELTTARSPNWHAGINAATSERV